VIFSLLLLRLAMLGYFIAAQGNYLLADFGPYLDLAANILKHHVFSLSTQAPFAAHVWRTPGYPVFLTLIRMLGLQNPYWIVVVQEGVYLLFVYIFFHFGRVLFDTKLLKISTAFALLEPGGLAFTKLVMTEIVFMPFLLMGILAVGYYLRMPNWRYLFLAGFSLGAGALIRPAVLYLPLFISLVLLLFALRSWRRWLHTGIFLLAFVSAMSPWLMRNYYHYGQLYFSGQSSYGLAYFHVPMVLEWAEGKTFDQGWDYVARRIQQESAKRSAEQGRPLSPKQVHDVERDIAIAELAKYPKIYLQRWIVGFFKGMASPLMIELYDAYGKKQDQRPSLIAEISGAKGLFGGLLEYVLQQDKLYLLDVIFSMLLAVFALLGALRIVTQKNAFLWVLMLTNFYFISVPGPMSHGRFRVPVELFWFIQAYFGFVWCVALLQRWRLGKKVPDYV